MSERIGIAAAVLSSALGGTAAAVTRFVIGATDPITLAAFRFGVGFLLLLPLALASRSRWPQRRDWAGVAGFGILFFAVFFFLYNVSFAHTTVARASLALSALPLVTMIVGAALRIERLTARKLIGVLIAMSGVAFALATGLSGAPEGAWRGDLVMLLATLCMALYTLWSRPFIARSGPLPFLTAGMGAGAACVVLLAWSQGGFAAASAFGRPQWFAVLYLGLSGAAANFYLWVFALERTTPTRVANTITVNPVTAGILAEILLNEPIGVNLIVGIVAVGTGIWIASTNRRSTRRARI